MEEDYGNVCNQNSVASEADFARICIRGMKKVAKKIGVAERMALRKERQA